MFSLSLLIHIAFFTAYSSQAKAVRILINNYGEADIEFIMLLILLPLNTFTTVSLIKKLDSEILNEKIKVSNTFRK